MRVEIRGKAIPASFPKIEGRGRSVGQKTGERGTDRRIGRWSEPRSRNTSHEQEAKEMSGEERLPEERWRRVGVPGSLRGGDQKK